MATDLNIGGFFPSFSSGDLLIILFAIIFLGVLFGGVIYYYYRKRWFIKVVFRMPRNFNKNSDGEYTGTFNYEFAKGMYNSNKGIVYIKRKRKRRQKMKPFDIKRHLSANNYLHVIQMSTGELAPVLEESYIQMKSEDPLINKKGEIILDERGKPYYEQVAWINTKADISKNHAWEKQAQRLADETFSVGDFVTKNATLITAGILVFINLIAFIYLASKI